jgi:hypothetical protein
VTGRAVWRSVLFPNHLNDDATVSVEISRGLLKAESEKLTSERGSVEGVRE